MTPSSSENSDELAKAIRAIQATPIPECPSFEIPTQVHRPLPQSLPFRWLALGSVAAAACILGLYCLSLQLFQTSNPGIELSHSNAGKPAENASHNDSPWPPGLVSRSSVIKQATNTSMITMPQDPMQNMRNDVAWLKAEYGNSSYREQLERIQDLWLFCSFKKEAREPSL